MLGLTLRPYQLDAVDAVFGWFRSNKTNPLVVVPTGGGKSCIMAALIHEIMQDCPNERVLCVTHVKELIAQNHAALLRAWPNAPAGIYSAGLGRREHDARILFAGVQSIVGRIGQIGWVDLVLVDECHRIPADGATQYQQVLTSLRSMNSNLRVVGFTATPFRTGEGLLSGGPASLFGGIAYTCEIKSLIEDGYLAPITSKGGREANIDLSGVRVRAGEFVEADQQDAAMAKVGPAVDQIMARADGRVGMLVFTCGVEHAHAVASELERRGVPSGCVTGEMANHERDAVIAAFKARQIRALVNVNVLTTGFDAPHTDMVVLLRATLSPVLYVQMVGRGFRTAPGKTDCLVLDFGQNICRHGPVDLVEVRNPKKRDQDEDEPQEGPKARECPTCGSFVLKEELTCPECGFSFPVAERRPRHDTRPEQDRPILATVGPVIERVAVIGTDFRMNVGRDGKPNTMRVEYRTGMSTSVREWVCFDHPDENFAKRKAKAWWKKCGGLDPAPSSVREAIDRAIAHELEQVEFLVVDKRGEYPRILGMEFGRRAGDEDGQGEAPASDLDYADLPF